MAAIVTFYGTTAPEKILARADFLGHFAEDDDVFEPIEEVRRLEEDIRSSGRQASFFYGDCSNADNPSAASMVWARYPMQTPAVESNAALHPCAIPRVVI